MALHDDDAEASFGVDYERRIQEAFGLGVMAHGLVVST